MHRDFIETSLVSNMKIAIVSPRRHTRESLSDVLAAGHNGLALSSAEGGIDQARIIADQQGPDVMLLEGTRHDESELLSIEAITANHPGLAVVLLSPNQSPEYLRLGMRVGLREILPPDADRSALLEMLAGVQQRRAAAIPARRGRIVSFIGCKGGSGATFIATNLAYALAARREKKLALIDLNFQFGDAAVHVSDRAPTRTIADVARDIHRIDGAFLASSMLHVLPNFHILAAPEEPDQALHVRSEEIGAILSAAAAHYDLVIIDAGRSMTEATVRSMDMADTVFCVLQQSLPFMRASQRWMRALNGLGYERSKVKLVLNRYHRNGLVDGRKVVETLKHELASVIPNSQFAVDDSINQGIPILQLAPKDAVSRALADLARSLAPVTQEASQGWLKGLLTRH